MRRLGARIRYFLRTALFGLRASPMTTAIAVATIGVTLLLLGAFVLLVSNMERLLDRFGEDILVSAYLEVGLPGEEQRALLERVQSAPGVESVRLVSEEEAMQRFREGSAGQAFLLEGLDENPLPASLEITLVPESRSSEGLAILVAALDGLRGIDEFGYGTEWVEGYARAMALIRGIGIAIGVVLALATLLIVSNTIRLAVYARRDEIEILRLVGAGRSFVSIPFLVSLGGIVAVALLYGFFRILLPGLESGLEFLLGFAKPAFIGTEGVLGLIVAGAVLGTLGSGLALVEGSEKCGSSARWSCWERSHRRRSELRIPRTSSSPCAGRSNSAVKGSRSTSDASAVSSMPSSPSMRRYGPFRRIWSARTARRSRRGLGFVTSRRGVSTWRRGSPGPRVRSPAAPWRSTRPVSLDRCA
jgi:cell division transport system permease protein